MKKPTILWNNPKKKQVKNMINHTFVICAYKESAYLENCIKSVLNQKLESKVIMVTSTDNSHIRGLAEKYKLELYVADHESDISRDWNYALSKADTRYVTIAHQDDIYDSNYTKKVMAKMEENEDSLICCTGYYEIRNNKRVKRNINLYIKRIMLLPLLIKSMTKRRFIKRIPIAFGNGICCPSVTYNTDNVTLPIFTEGMKSNIDWEAWEKLSNVKGRFCYCPDLLMGHRIHNESTTTQIIEDNSRGDEDYFMFRKFWGEKMSRFLTKVYGNSENSNKL